jgi:predicted oxidoreductase
VSAIPAEVDVVVAGSGVAGLAAAVTLCEAGASVALFEKQRSLGGSSNFFHGTSAVESRMQRDKLFAKPARFLRPLVGPMYYAVKARTVCLGTMGGIKIDEHMQALDKRGAAIPGLYAGGYDAGGMFGDSYPIRESSGLSSAFAINSGRIAGRNALRYLGL